MTFLDLNGENLEKEREIEISTKRKITLCVNTGTKVIASKEIATIFTAKRTVKLTYLVKCVEKNNAEKGIEKHVGTGTRMDAPERKTVLTFTEKPGSPEINPKEQEKGLVVDMVVLEMRIVLQEADTEMKV